MIDLIIDGQFCMSGGVVAFDARQFVLVIVVRQQSLKKVKSTGQLTYKFTPFHAYLLLSNLFRVLHGLNLLLSNFFDFFMKSTLNYPNLRTYELLLFGKLVISYSRNCPHKISWTQK